MKSGKSTELDVTVVVALNEVKKIKAGWIKYLVCCI